ncbi:MAG: IS66 family insertion sequence element accessory protein TnpB [Burkholderiaceae bacterium]|jgi:transposase
MLTIASQTRIFIALHATDMRKGFDGLSGLVSDTLKQDPLSGALFLFVNRRRDRLKVLYWDGDGLAIWYRRLEQGTFQIPSSNDQLNAIEIRSDEFTMLLRGIDLSSVKRRKRFQLAS